MQSLIPSGPWKNPSVKEGIHNAQIIELTETVYGRDNDPMLKVLFRLLDTDDYFVTHLYFPKAKSIRSQQRLYHFCGCVGLPKYAVLEEPESFVNRCLRLDIRVVTPTKANYGVPYHDVFRFLPPEEDRDDEIEHENEIEALVR
jgi:hypothetical protein